MRGKLEILADGTALDGRHRLRAAIELGMKEVPVIDAPLNRERPEVYMMKAAVLRRHLTDDQRSVISAKWKEENKKQGERTDLTSASRSAEVKDIEHPTRAEAMELFRVSRSKIDKASYILKRRPDLADKVHQGEMTLNNAYQKTQHLERLKNNKQAEINFPSGSDIITGPARQKGIWWSK
jgi:hypothetical protein